MTSEDASRSRPQTRRGIQSIETGFALLQALVEAAVALPLGELARLAGMSSAKAHPYLVSFLRTGVVRQDPSTGHYELGPFALQMGLVSLQRLEPVRLAHPIAKQLASEIGHTIGIAILGSHGPTILHICEGRHPVYINMRQGTVLSMQHTATGKVFSAWLEPAIAQHYIEREQGDLAVVTQADTRALSSDQWADALAHVKRRRLARARGYPLAGINAFAVPVLNHAGDILMVLTCLGPSSQFDANWNSPIAKQLKQGAAELSKKLGFRPDVFE